MADIKVTLWIDDRELWSRIWGSSPSSFGSHWQGIEYLDGADWDTVGKVKVTMEDPEGEGSVTKVLGMADIVEALGRCQTHIVTDVIEDDVDCVVADYVIQVAMFDECVYG